MRHSWDFRAPARHPALKTHGTQGLGGDDRMSHRPRPPIPELIPESAPFTLEQRTWLNGFFSGLLSLDGAGIKPCRRRKSAR